MPNFFGLPTDYQIQLYEILFHFKYYSSFTLGEVMSMPIGLRNWFYERLKTQLEEEAANKKQKS